MISLNLLIAAITVAIALMILNRHDKQMAKKIRNHH